MTTNRTWSEMEEEIKRVSKYTPEDLKNNFYQPETKKDGKRMEMGVFTCTKKVMWTMGHRLPNHDGQCRFFHGHNYSAEVTFERNDGKVDSECGFVLDFGKMTALKKLVDDWDHGFMLWEEDPLIEQFAEMIKDNGVDNLIKVSYNPTAENIAFHIFGEMQLEYGTQGLKVREVVVHENEGKNKGAFHV